MVRGGRTGIEEAKAKQTKAQLLTNPQRPKSCEASARKDNLKGRQFRLKQTM